MLALLASLALALSGLVGFVGLTAVSASAAPTCTAAGDYPPGSCGISQSREEGAPGEYVEFTTPAVFKSHEEVNGEFHSTVYNLGNYQADANGVVSGSYQIPLSASPGQHEFTLTGLSSGQFLSAGIFVTGTVAASTPPSGGSLPFTGAVILPVVGVGAGLLVAGSVLLMVIRRRRPIAGPGAVS